MNGLTEKQRAILTSLASGQIIAYSQDGEVGWLWPSREVLADDDIWSLRDAGYIEKEPFDAEEHVRFGPGDLISDAGRAALTQEPTP